MMTNDPEDGAYEARNRLRRAYEEWLAQTDMDLFATLSLAENTGLQQGRQKIGRWLAYIDNHYIGRGWSKRPSSERTEAFIFPESIDTNLHYHCLMRLPPRAQAESLAVRAAVLERLWRKIEWRGTCEVDWVRDADAARYVTKQLVRPGYLDQIIIASEFHRDRSQDVAPQPKSRPVDPGYRG
jgi:hypothetical protein